MVASTESLTVTDNRTGKRYDVAIEEGAVRATSFKQMRTGAPDDVGLRVFDPSYMNTAAARSAITYIDGEKGQLHYRGYPIEQLAEKSSFLEVAFLLIYGELPSASELKEWSDQIMTHTFVHENLKDHMQAFRFNSHPMGMLISSMSALSTFFPDANPALAGSDLFVDNQRVRNKQIFRIIGKAPTMAAMAYRHRIGRSFNDPKAGLSYTGNFLYMMDKLADADYQPHPVLERALDVLFILHADHELNCSTAAMRHIGSSQVDPYSACAGAACALYGPLHGGANEAVLRMLERIGTKEGVPAFLERVKQRKEKLMGFGHRVYRSYDPRAKIIRKVAYEVFEVTGKEPLIEVALELEKAALADEFFRSRSLYPNVDFFAGCIYKAMGFPTDIFPVLFAIPRMVGWLAHWSEAIQDPSRKIWRPRQIYTGPAQRPYVEVARRPSAKGEGTHLDSLQSVHGKRIRSKM